MNELLKTAIRAALEAGKVILEIYNSNDFVIKNKVNNSPLTKADTFSNNIIMSILTTTGIPVLSEEAKTTPYKQRRGWNQLWIVDPLDGTKEFIKRNGEFTVNIALIEKQKPVLGVVLAPTKRELYFSTKLKGSYKVSVNLELYDINNLINKASKIPLKADNKVYTIVASRSHMSKETEDFINGISDNHSQINFITIGSSLKLCMVAEGLANCYPRFAPTMEWDTAARQAICEHAGFQVIDLKTKTKMTYNKENLINNWFLVN